MKAVRFHDHGGPDVLTFEDVPDPRPAAGEAVVRVRACALNRLDIWERQGMPHVGGRARAGGGQRGGAGGHPGGPAARRARVRNGRVGRQLERARALGASAVIHHHREDIAEEIKRLTNRRGVDVVIEHVGEATWPNSVRSLARGGRLVTRGATTGANGAIDLRALFAKQLTLHGSYIGTKAKLLEAAPLFFAGELKPVVGTFPLAEAAAARRRLERSEQFGKIVLEVG
jgi:NADPH:quinone reductase-like Zn-dependent oxidoreductase